MISPLSVATGGWLGSPQAVATDGYLDQITVTITPTPGGGAAAADEGGGGQYQRHIPRPSWREASLTQDDAEMVEILAILFTADIL